MLVYKTQSELTRAFVRVQEHYESPKFKDKIFTLGEYREWYAGEYGTWSYFSDWEGFNVPLKVFEKFIRGSFDPLMKEEQELIEIIRYIPDDYYVIATFEAAKADVREHELAHALYATDAPYRARVDELFKEQVVSQLTVMPGDAAAMSMEHLIAKMKELGYHEGVILDECHAYMAASQAWLREENVGFPSELASCLRSNLLRSLEDA